ncbi:hypothetical protein [Roseovarius sp. SYSU LYC5161]|jgi:hypothetical protein|uniref:hypothetical protein n=1 Tax=Roseovarius halophilus (ex Wu et al. 2025) TaxID=3376060 RepID=UPI0028714F47|nr:hypothetical protein [Roseovarius sp.]
MAANTLAFLLLTPFVIVFGYATWHEYRRYKSEGRSTYGLSYDPETDSTHVTTIGEDEASFDPETDSGMTGTHGTPPDNDDNEQDTSNDRR